MGIVKEERIGNQRLILGDCLQVMPTLGRFDHVMSDPPFEAEAHTMQRRTNGRKVAGDGRYHRELDAAPLDFAPITEDQRAGVARESVRLADKWMLFFCQAEAVQAWREMVEAAGGKYKRPMIWVKPDALPQMSGDRPAMGYESIVAGWAGRGRSFWNAGGKRGVYIHNKGEGNLGKNPHPTMKPVALMCELLADFTAPGDAILDPFMGSGTTLVACQRMGRQGTGIELDPEYFEIACRRVDEAARQPDLFIAPKDEPPVQEGFDL